MRLTLGAKVVEILGDPHLGKVFKTGVPLHRRGEREASQWVDFRDSLWNVEGCTHHVMMGDLFHSFMIPYETVLRAASYYKHAAYAYDDVVFVVLMGNHDQVRDLSKKSAFDVFAALVEEVDNIHVVKDNSLLLDNFLFIPWSPWYTAREMVQEAIEIHFEDKFDAVFGHWEIEGFGGADENLCPYDLLAKITDTVVTGHIHVPQEFERDGLRVIVTGSMQAYAHGEGDPYVTLRLDEIEGKDLRDKCVRVILEPGEELPEIDCLQLTKARPGVLEVEEGEVGDVEIAAFDFEKVFRETLEKEGVEASLIDALWDLYGTLKTEDVE